MENSSLSLAVLPLVIIPKISRIGVISDKYPKIGESLRAAVHPVGDDHSPDPLHVLHVEVSPGVLVVVSVGTGTVVHVRV